MTTLLRPTVDPLVDLDRARALLARGDLAALVAHSYRNVFYLSGYSCFDYIIEPEAIVFAVLARLTRAPLQVVMPMSERHVPLDFPIWSQDRVLFGDFYIEGAPDIVRWAPSAVNALADVLEAASVNSGRVGLELDLLPQKFHKLILEMFPAIEVVDASPILKELRTLKTPQEIERIRTATQLTERAISDAFGRICVGVTEREVAQWIMMGLVERGAEPVYVQVGTNGRGALGVAYPTDREVQAGDVIRTDVSATYGNYHSDLGRCCVVGKATPRQARCYQISYEALLAAINAIKPGKQIADSFDAGVGIPRRYGLESFKRHHVGHGIGLQAHEWPFLRPNDRGVFKPGMVLAVEVPYYVYGLGGFSPEDILVVTEEAVELFSQAPAELPAVG